MTGEETPASDVLERALFFVAKRSYGITPKTTPRWYSPPSPVVP